MEKIAKKLGDLRYHLKSCSKNVFPVGQDIVLNTGRQQLDLTLLFVVRYDLALQLAGTGKGIKKQRRGV